MRRPLRWYDHISASIAFLGLTVLSQTNGLVFPLLIQQFVGEQAKGSYLGTLRLWTLMVALLWQAMIGMLSDRSTFAWGRRRPFILTGTLAMLALIVAVGATSGMNGMTGFAVLFAVAVLLQFASNTVQGSAQGLIPDVIPESQRGRASAVKAIFEVPLPLILVSFTIARMIAAGQMVAGMVLAAAIMLVSALVAMLAPESRPERGPRERMDWAPVGRLALMTAAFTVIILGSGWLARQIEAVVQGVDSATTVMLVMGLVGLAAMAFAVGVGVWISVRISIGAAGVRQNPSFTWWVMNRLAFFVGTTNLSTFAVYFLQGRLGLEREKAAGPAALLMTVIGIFILLSALPSGWLGDRFGHRRLVGIAGIVAGLGVAIALLAPNMNVIYAGGVLIGIATGFFFTSNWALGTEIAPKAEAGRYLGISNLAGAGAGAVGAYIGGPIADFVTAQAPGIPGAGYVLLFGIYGVMFVLSVVALRGVNLPRTVVLNAKTSGI